MDPFLGEVRIMPYTFAPRGWAWCRGQLLPIASNAALFSIIGTAFGGNGTSTFGLPDLQGAVPIGAGTGPGLTPRVVGESGGTTSVTLTTGQMPAHNHTVQGDGDAFNATSLSPNGAVPANVAPTLIYAVDGAPTLVPMHTAMVSLAGGGLAHDNLMPYLVVNYCIALSGIFPQRG